MKWQGFIVLCVMLFSLPVQMTEAAWENWWKTPEQQALNAFEQGDHETLINHGPDASWRGLGHYQADDYDAASASFAEAAQQRQLEGDTTAANRARFNQGVSAVRAGRYQQAIDQFDAVLDADPGFADAAYNRNIAEKLIQLEDQARQQKSSGESSPDQQGDQSDKEAGEGDTGDGSGQTEQDQGDQQDDKHSKNQSDQEQTLPGDSATDENSDSQQGASADNGSQRESTDEDDSLVRQSAEQQAMDAEQARQALAAEAAQQAQQNQDADNQPAASDSLISTERPMTESEQATEQLLRRIPDDPAGLLRRKLEQSHLIEYPEVRDSNEPW